MNLEQTGIAIDTEYWEHGPGRTIETYVITGFDGTTRYFWSNLVDAKKQDCYVPFDVLKAIIEDTRIPKYFHNAKADIKSLRSLGVGVGNIGFDTMLAAYVLNPVKKKYGLKPMVGEHFGIDMVDYGDRFKAGETYKDIYERNPEEAAKYAIDDAYFTYKLVKLFQPQIDKKFPEVYYKIELPLIALLTKMEMQGILIDREMLKRLKDEYQTESNDLEGKLLAIANPIVRRM